MRGAISRSLAGVLGSTGPVEGGTGVMSTAMGVVVSRGDSIGMSDGAEWMSETKSARGGMACVKAETEDVLCGGEGSVGGQSRDGGRRSGGQGGGRGEFRQGCLRGS